MVVDEEGMMRNKPTNNAATDVLWEITQSIETLQFYWEMLLSLTTMR